MFRKMYFVLNNAYLNNTVTMRGIFKIVNVLPFISC